MGGFNGLVDGGGSVWGWMKMKNKKDHRSRLVEESENIPAVAKYPILVGLQGVYFQASFADDTVRKPL